MKCCINDKNFISLLLSTELFKLEIQKYGEILCVHKPYFLMPGHVYVLQSIIILHVCFVTLCLECRHQGCIYNVYYALLKIDDRYTLTEQSTRLIESQIQHSKLNLCPS